MVEPRREDSRGIRLRRAAAAQAGWLAAAAGAALSVLGWFGVSGERFAERQIPFLASATIPGAALIVAGAVLLARRMGDASATAARVAELHRLLVADSEAEAGQAAAGEAAVGPGGALPPDERRYAVPGGTVHHRADCPLVEGKPDARPVDEAAIRERSLRPCPVCEREDGG